MLNGFHQFLSVLWCLLLDPLSRHSSMTSSITTQKRPFIFIQLLSHKLLHIFSCNFFKSIKTFFYLLSLGIIFKSSQININKFCAIIKKLNEMKKSLFNFLFCFCRPFIVDLFFFHCLVDVIYAENIFVRFSISIVLIFHTNINFAN
jgi:hypothetical protein